MSVLYIICDAKYSTVLCSIYILQRIKKKQEKCMQCKIIKNV